MTIKRLVTVISLAGVVFSLLAFVPNKIVRPNPVAFAEEGSKCVPVGGMLMTNIGAIAGTTNLGPVSGDLAGSVAATILGENSNGSFNVQHYWVTSAGDTITFAVAVLSPTYPIPGNTAVVAVPWGHYTSNITGGAGKYQDAKGSLTYTGMADFSQNTLVLRYRGEVCYTQ
jgi:hypothetical protein